MRQLLAPILLLVSGGAFAQPVHYYKSVHADGTVGYSDTQPPSAASVEPVDIQQEDPAILQQGEQRVQEMKAAGDALEAQRAAQAKAAREYRERLAEAREAVADAELNLRISIDSKHNATPYRIGLAEERLKLARERLMEVQRSGR